MSIIRRNKLQQVIIISLFLIRETARPELTSKERRVHVVNYGHCAKYPKEVSTTESNSQGCLGAGIFAAALKNLIPFSLQQDRLLKLMPKLY